MEPLVPQSTVVASPSQVSSAVADEAVILDLARGIYYGLDPVGARIWQLLQRPTTVSAIRGALVAEYDVELARCDKDLLALLTDLRAHSLIEVVDAPVG